MVKKFSTVNIYLHQPHCLFSIFFVFVQNLSTSCSNLPGFCVNKSILLMLIWYKFLPTGANALKSAPHTIFITIFLPSFLLAYFSYLSCCISCCYCCCKGTITTTAVATSCILRCLYPKHIHKSEFLTFAAKIDSTFFFVSLSKLFNACTRITTYLCQIFFSCVCYYKLI